MNYELALELKEAGFPIPFLSIDSPDDGHGPSLERLIEACGDDFNILVRSKDGFWYAESEQGKTPPEAVARLWLALNPNTPTV